LNHSGRHLLASYHGCDPSLLNDRLRIEGLLRRAAEAAGARPLTSAFHAFEPQGVTGVIVVEESHLSIHTWPERGFAAVDFFTCGSCDPERAHAVLRDGLGAERCELMLVERGSDAARRAMRVLDHREESSEALASGGRSALPAAAPRP
jgi:S-adenosylmethionine decarboxylase proenzyme